MARKPVHVGHIYVAKISNKLAPIRIEKPTEFRTRAGWATYWYATNLMTGRQVQIRSAAKLREDITERWPKIEAALTARGTPPKIITVPTAPDPEPRGQGNNNLGSQKEAHMAASKRNTRSTNQSESDYNPADNKVLATLGTFMSEDRHGNTSRNVVEIRQYLDFAPKVTVRRAGNDRPYFKESVDVMAEVAPLFAAHMAAQKKGARKAG